MYPLTFENGDTNVYWDNIPAKNHLFIDTITNPNNIWQIGKPIKPVFNSAYSVPNVIVTDTINSYPINDTSSFVFKNEANMGFYFGYEVSIKAYYYVNSDTLTDYGKIEFSPDNGSTWIDLLNDTIYDQYIIWSSPWVGVKPVFSGNSNGWRFFAVDITQLGPVLNIQTGDTVLYRFSFISDGIQTNKDGLMFDSFWYKDVVESIDEYEIGIISSKSYPSPANREITIEFGSNIMDKSNLKIFDCFGKLIISHTVFNENKIKLNTEALKSGLYSYFLYDDKDSRKMAKGKFIIQK